MMYGHSCAALLLSQVLSLLSAKALGESSPTTTMLRSSASTISTSKASGDVPLSRMLSFDTADTVETYYSESAQAWRMLGLYLDCEAQEDGSSVCQRYLLWAAYVDEEYMGYGEGEYMYYDSETGKWDDSACDATGSRRCVKLDCHLPNTRFKLLGYYKQYGANDFLEQLFAHQGSCTWTEDEYYFMENSREAWPQGCTQSATTDENGSYVYYDIKPLTGGRMTIGLYSNALCSVTYHGSLTVKEAIEVDDEADDGNANAYGSDFGTDAWFDEWNNALEPYKTCQPCVVSSLSNGAAASRRRRRLEEDNGDNGQEDGENGEQEQDQAANDDGLFTCQDAAGYQGANQCSMFALNTDIQPASFRDVRLATLQGTIAQTHAAYVTSSRMNKWWRTWGFFTLSVIVFLIGLVLFCNYVKVKKRTISSTAKEPLLSSSNRSNSGSASTKVSNKSTNNKSNSKKSRASNQKK